MPLRPVVLGWPSIPSSSSSARVSVAASLTMARSTPGEGSRSIRSSSVWSGSAARYGHTCRPMQPRFTAHTMWATSAATSACEGVPLGVCTVVVCSQSGAFLGTRFGKNVFAGFDRTSVRPAAAISAEAFSGIPSLAMIRRPVRGFEQMTTDLASVIRRNTLLLSTTSAVNSVVLQLAAAVSTLTFVLVTGHAGLLGLGPAIFLTSSGVTAVIAGRTMDRHGRRPVLAVGFVALSSGCALNALATRTSSVPALLAGLVLIGVGMATSLLIRTAAGDMYAPERRARGISYVLFGSVFGAILGPAVFSPMFAGKHVNPDVLTVPWLAAAGIALVAMAIVMLVRPDTREIAIQIGAEQGAPPPGAAAPLAEILRRPGVLPAMAASLASFAVMVSVMNLSGYVVVQVHHHAQDAV